MTKHFFVSTPHLSLLFLMSCLVSCLFFMSPSHASSPSLDTCRTANPTWYQCSADTDCLIIYNPCGWPNDAALHAFADTAKECSRRAGAALSCVPFDEAQAEAFVAKCVRGQCLAVKKQ